jgi:Myb-like DNA-binding domain
MDGEADEGSDDGGDEFVEGNESDEDEQDDGDTFEDNDREDDDAKHSTDGNSDMDSSTSQESALFSKQDDDKLLAALKNEKYHDPSKNLFNFGYTFKWSTIATKEFHGKFQGAQLSSRYTRVICPLLKHGNWTEEEDETILALANEGHKCKKIAE